MTTLSWIYVNDLWSLQDEDGNRVGIVQWNGAHDKWKWKTNGRGGVNHDLEAAKRSAEKAVDGGPTGRVLTAWGFHGKFGGRDGYAVLATYSREDAARLLGVNNTNFEVHAIPAEPDERRMALKRPETVFVMWDGRDSFEPWGERSAA